MAGHGAARQARLGTASGAGMSTFSEARAALAAQLAAKLPDLHVYAAVPGTITVPAVIVAPATGGLADYEQAESSDLVAWSLRVIMLAGMVNLAVAQGELDDLLSTTAATSVVAAIRTDPTLGGLAEYAEVRTASRYGQMSYNGIDFLGAELSIAVSC